MQVDITDNLDGDNEHLEPPGEQDDRHSEASDHDQPAGDHEDGRSSSCVRLTIQRFISLVPSIFFVMFLLNMSDISDETNSEN